MANLPINLPKFKQILIPLSNFTNLSSHFFPYSNSKVHYQRQILKKNTTSYNYRLLSRRSFVEYEDEDYLNSENYSFQEAVALFNSRDYYRQSFHEISNDDPTCSNFKDYNLTNFSSFLFCFMQNKNRKKLMYFFLNY